MTTLEALWLGLVQGLTEFLPVSSSGHLVIFQTLLGIEGEGGLLFEIAVHVATLLAIVIYFRTRIIELVRGFFKGQPDAMRYVGKLAVATLPAVAVGLFAKDYVDEVLTSPTVTGVCLLVTGCLLWTTRRTLGVAAESEPTWAAALAIGVAQAFAILPGISRSGATVVTALAFGVAAQPAAEFSFLLGIIAISGAAVLALPDLAEASPEALTALGLGCGAALVSGILAIWLFIMLLKKQSFHVFAYYTWTVGVVFLLWLHAG